MEENVKHFACPCNCGGMSDHEKACETEGCQCKGQTMKECGCTDMMHSEISEKTGEQTAQVCMQLAW